MDDYVKTSIDARKKAIFNAVEVSDKQKKEIDDLFSQIEELGTSCTDVSDFETKFAASPLNQQYMDLFTKIATEGATKNTMRGAAAGAVASVAESAARNAIGSTVPTTRAAVHQKAYDAARDIPVVGDAIDVSEKASYIKHLGGLFSKKK